MSNYAMSRTGRCYLQRILLSEEIDRSAEVDTISTTVDNASATVIVLKSTIRTWAQAARGLEQRITELENPTPRQQTEREIAGLIENGKIVTTK